MDFLHPNNCNKAHCKSCIFHPDPKKRLRLSASRETEILTYLYTMQHSHQCHVTDKTCYGGLEHQAKACFALGMIAEPTVEAFLDQAAKVLGFDPEK